MSSLQQAKCYDDLDYGQWKALATKCGGFANVVAILRGEKIVKVEDVSWIFFDKNGRRIPANLQAKVCDPDIRMRLDQPKLNNKTDFSNRLKRLKKAFVGDLPEKHLSEIADITVKQFMTETERLLTAIKENSQIANIANGVYLPIVIPRLATNDLGAEIDLYLAGVKKSHLDTSECNRKFYKGQKCPLPDVFIANESRHKKLIAQIKQKPIIGLHFPNPLQGFSINASYEQMSSLPEEFILSGIDTLIAMIMYPDVLDRSWNVPALNLAALQNLTMTTSLCLETERDFFDFVSVNSLSLSEARFGHSNGLLFLG